ncbi:MULTISPECIES: hypothetical protein [Peribacillus]|uniref:hypothetical protein n=1 Tax=Peribacillus TaxID=2675229 RepID=UPI001F4E4268|nr:MULTISPECIES: hypothetical protein [unclassified Peribacillus]MCK1981525.1 hypothetical protein [Peribacillus sp. Aquil_B1]MCK2006728.1 hypothetical protein [Peribacillus sp. Aquil_B8]
MAGSGRFLASIQDKSIHLAVFEKMLKGDVSFEHFMFQLVLLSSNRSSTIQRKTSLIEMPTVDRRPKAVNIPTGERRYKV